jgi:hypothetical protein
MRGVVVAVLVLLSCVASAAAPGPAPVVETNGLRSIAGWLKVHGQAGYVGADVANAMGIPRVTDEEIVEAMQRGFRDEKVLRIAQVIGTDTLLFMVQAEGEVYFYLSSVRGGLRKAMVSVPSRESVTPLGVKEAETNFRLEVQYWEQKVTR